MTDLTPNHPAVEAAHTASQAWMDDVACKLPRDEMVYILTAALPHLTADDLRDTPAGRALMAEGRDARPPEPLPCGCENPLNAVHLLDH